MKRSLFFVPFAVILLVLPFFSCASAAPAAEQPAAPEQPSSTTAIPQADTPPALNALNAAVARAEESRKRAGDFEGADYFPSDWEAADEQLENAKSMPKTTDSEVQSAVAAFNAAADAFDSIFNGAVPLYAQAREDEIMDVWNELVAAGARVHFPEYFTPADETAVSAYEQYEAGDYYGAKNAAEKALLMYQTLKAGHNAYLAREEIVKMDFASYDPDNFDKAGASYEAAMDNYDAGNLPGARENAQEALETYNKVLYAGWLAYAQQRSALASRQRQIALNIKANIATRDLFIEADTSLDSAKDLFGMENYAEAAQWFMKAETQFMIASISTAEKRRIAEDALIEASERIYESVEAARQAEITLEGGAE